MPLVVRFPALARLPRAPLGTGPTPVVSLAPRQPNLWLKRDDRSASPLGGNKARALEFLLGGIGPGDRVVTVGSAGSTHALAVATYARRLGARCRVGRWRQEMNPAAALVAAHTAAVADAAPIYRTVLGAYLYAWRERWRGARWIAAGGSTPLGVLGHVNAALELVEQADAGLLPRPAQVVVPLGTGGTAAGLALGFAIAGLEATVVGVRVVPRVVARAGHVRRLAERTARQIERLTGERVPRPGPDALRVVHDAYGGAYGRVTARGTQAAAWLGDAAQLGLDATYSAKAFGVALDLAARAPTLFWLTFDARALAAPAAGPVSLEAPAGSAATAPRDDASTFTPSP